MDRRPLLALLLLTLALVGLGLALLPDGAREHEGEGLVSLHPSLTETLVAIGAADQLVGRSDYCGDAEVAHLPAVGSSLTPNLEAIAGLRPGRILVEGSAGARVDQLGQLAPVQVLPWLDLDEVVASIRELGALSGKSAEAEALAARFAERLGKAPPPDAPRVLLVLSVEEGGPVWFLRDDSLHGAALRAAGYRNAVTEAVSGPPTLSLEGLIALDPDALVFLAPEGTDAAAIEAARHQLDAIEPLTAPDRGQIHALAGPYLGTGPHILELADALEALPIDAASAAPAPPTEARPSP